MEKFQSNKLIVFSIEASRRFNVFSKKIKARIISPKIKHQKLAAIPSAYGSMDGRNLLEYELHISSIRGRGVLYGAPFFTYEFPMPWGSGLPRKEVAGTLGSRFVTEITSSLSSVMCVL